MSIDVDYNLKPANVGSEVYFFQGANGVDITTSDDKTYRVYPIVAGDFKTGEIGEGFERAYFLIKWFSAVDGDANTVTHVNPSASAGTVTFTGSADPLGLGTRRYKTVENGEFLINITDDETRTIPASSGPIRSAELNISEIPSEATHFIAWMVKY